MSGAVDREAVKAYLLGLQDRICSELERADGSGRFRRDGWRRAEGGVARAACCATARCSSRAASTSRT